MAKPYHRTRQSSVGDGRDHVRTYRNAKDWKGKLADVVNLYNKMHANGHKTVSYRTREARRNGLYRSFAALWMMGFKIMPEGLRDKHIFWLMRYWTGDLRVATLPRDRKEKLTPREKPYSAAYIQQQLSFLRVFATWIGKKGMIRSAKYYTDNPALVTRKYPAQYDHSWSATLPSAEELIAKVEAANPWVGVQLRMMLAFGLRRKEAVMFHPHVSEVEEKELPVAHQGNGNYLVFVRVEEGTKGGRLRFTPVRNGDQVRALQAARNFAPSKSSHLGEPGLTLKQSLKKFDNTMRKFGITKALLGITSHGLRHQFAGDLFLEVTEIPAPIRGGDPIEPEAMRAAYLKVARQLGHGRPAISSAYLGSRKARKKQHLEPGHSPRV